MHQPKKYYFKSLISSIQYLHILALFPYLERVNILVPGMESLITLFVFYLEEQNTSQQYKENKNRPNKSPSKSQKLNPNKPLPSPFWISMLNDKWKNLWTHSGDKDRILT